MEKGNNVTLLYYEDGIRPHLYVAEKTDGVPTELIYSIYIVDDEYLIAQHYLPTAMGVDSPCLLIKRSEGEGLYEQYNRVFENLWNRTNNIALA